MGIRPCFYSNTIRGIFKGAISNKHSYRVFVRLLSKAPYTYAVSRSAPNVCNANLFAPVAKRNSIVASLDGCVYNVDPNRSTDVNSISIGAIFWSNNPNTREGDIFATQHVYVELLAV